jgi:hypothetical protein
MHSRISQVDETTMDKGSTMNPASGIKLPIPDRGAGIPGTNEHAVVMTRVGLQITQQLTFDTWELAGHRLSGVVDSSTWCLGDWLVYGKRTFPDRYHHAIRTAGLQYQTLRNYAWVSRRFSLDRRRSTLTFQHHAEVASLPTDEQNWWLDQAEEGMWTTKQLRNQIRAERNALQPAAKNAIATTAIVHIPIESSRLPSWQKAAQSVGINLDEWVMATLDRAAEQAVQSA